MLFTDCETVRQTESSPTQMEAENTEIYASKDMLFKIVPSSKLETI